MQERYCSLIREAHRLTEEDQMIIWGQRRRSATLIQEHKQPAYMHVLHEKINTEFNVRMRQLMYNPMGFLRQ